MTEDGTSPSPIGFRPLMGGGSSASSLPTSRSPSRRGMVLVGAARSMTVCCKPSSPAERKVSSGGASLTWACSTAHACWNSCAAPEVSVDIGPSTTGSNSSRTCSRPAPTSPPSAMAVTSPDRAACCSARARARVVVPGRPNACRLTGVSSSPPAGSGMVVAASSASSAPGTGADESSARTSPASKSSNVRCLVSPLWLARRAAGRRAADSRR